MEVSGQLHDSSALPPTERAPGSHWIGGWVGPTALLDAVVKRKILRLRKDDEDRQQYQE